MELAECGAFRDDATVTRVALSSIRATKLHGIHVIYAVHCCSTQRVETAFPRGAWERVKRVRLMLGCQKAAAQPT
jgi:hypothetical protein